jgi:hypothetical protein
MQLKLLSISVYPIKSLAGITLEQSNALVTGLQWDRNWLLVDEGGKQITQRQFPKLALLQPELSNTHLSISAKSKTEYRCDIRLDEKGTEPIKVKVWDDVCTGMHLSEFYDEFFTDYLKFPCKLVRMPTIPDRWVRAKNQPHEIPVSFADGYPYLIISDQSLNFLNNKLGDGVEMRRFRPNLVLQMEEAHQEDQLDEFALGSALFKMIKPCGRCMITTINPETAEKGREPLLTLNTYRRQHGQVNFGFNAICIDSGKITKGDQILVKSWR